MHVTHVLDHRLLLPAQLQKLDRCQKTAAAAASDTCTPAALLHADTITQSNPHIAALCKESMRRLHCKEIHRAACTHSALNCRLHNQCRQKHRCMHVHTT